MNLYAQQYVDEIFVPTKHHGKHLALYEPPINAAAVLPRHAEQFRWAVHKVLQVVGISGARSSPRNEPLTAACRCHQCTRRTRSLLEDRITISALLFHKT